MALENIEKKVLEAARAEGEALVREAETQAAARVSEARAATENRARRALVEAEHLLRLAHDQKVMAARAANRLELLRRKAALLDDVFAGAVERFIGDRSGPYRAWLAAQLESVADETGSVLPAEADRAAVGDLLARMHGAGRGKGLTLESGSLPLKGGCVVHGASVDIDLSLETRLAGLKNEILPGLAERAFGRKALKEDAAG